MTLQIKYKNKPGSCVNPSPILRDNADIVIFLWLNPHFPIICNPLITIVPNIIIVHPPSTALGSVASIAPTAGKIPASIIMIPPVARTYLFTTLVMATNPTFWLKNKLYHTSSPLYKTSHLSNTCIFPLYCNLNLIILNRNNAAFVISIPRSPRSTNNLITIRF